MRTELLKARKDARMTQGQMAKIAGIDRTAYNRIETGARKPPNVEVALKIAQAVGKTVEDIFLPSDVADRHKMMPTGTG